VTTSDSPAAARNERNALLVVIAFIVVLGSVWVVGSNGQAPSENRNKVAFPEISGAAVLQPKTFAAIDASIRDRIPARPLVLNSIAATLEPLSMSYSNRVVLGEGGAPFLTDDLFGPCFDDAREVPGILNTLRTQTESLKEKGQYSLFVIAPDKSSIMQGRSHGGIDSSYLSCSNSVRKSLESLAPSTSFLPAWNDLNRAQDNSSLNLYRPGDTHWNTVGASVFVRTILTRLVKDGQAPAELADQISFTRTPDEVMGGDLYALLGQDWRTDLAPVVEADRPDVVTKTTKYSTNSGRGATRWTSVATTSALVPGKTLVIGDSFFEAAGSLAAPYFQDLTLVVNLDGNDPPSAILNEHYDRIIVEQVQRGWTSIANNYVLLK